jgi:hypothetical protein
MTFGNMVRGAAAVAALGMVLAFAGLARADDNITESHLKAAHAAITAIKATDVFDVILPEAAQALKADLIQRDPNLEQVIIKTVDQQTMALVGRRADLEKEAARAYAQTFTEKELNEIAAFYSTPTGQKLIANGPIVTRKLTQAAEIWQRGIARDLSKAVGDSLKAQGVDSTAVPDESNDDATANAGKDAAKQ